MVFLLYVHVNVFLNSMTFQIVFHNMYNDIHELDYILVDPRLTMVVVLLLVVMPKHPKVVQVQQLMLDQHLGVCVIHLVVLMTCPAIKLNQFFCFLNYVNIILKNIKELFYNFALPGTVALKH